MGFTVIGYGSLVNRATLPPYLEARPILVPGFRRAWRAAGRTARGGVCSLSVVRDETCAIEGLAVTFDESERTTMTLREHRYVPLRLPDEAIIYQAEPEIDRYGDADHPIELSYVDVILQGYLREFGLAGAERFMATTDGWHVPIRDDRACPNYPRAQKLTAEERAIVDRLLGGVDARVT